MSNKAGKFLVFGAALGAVAVTIMYLKKHRKPDWDTDFDQEDDDPYDSYEVGYSGDGDHSFVTFNNKDADHSCCIKDGDDNKDCCCKDEGADDQDCCCKDEGADDKDCCCNKDSSDGEGDGKPSCCQAEGSDDEPHLSQSPEVPVADAPDSKVENFYDDEA